jgi:hypothetical protein
MNRASRTGASLDTLSALGDSQTDNQNDSYGNGKPLQRRPTSEPTACAIAQSFLKEGLRSPRSTPPMYVRSMSECSARSSWEKPLAFRACLMRSPSTLSEVGFFNHHTLRYLMIYRPRTIIIFLFLSLRCLETSLSSAPVKPFGDRCVRSLNEGTGGCALHVARAGLLPCGYGVPLTNKY